MTGFAGMPSVNKRDERGLGTGVVGAFRAGDAGDGAVAEFFRSVGDALFDGIGGEGREDGAAAGQNAQRRADRGAAQNRADHALEVVARRHQVGDLGHQHFARALVFEVAQDFGDAEDADRQGDEVQAVRIFPDPQGEAWRAGVDVGADEAEQEAERHHRQGLDD